MYWNTHCAIYMQRGTAVCTYKVKLCVCVFFFSEKSIKTVSVSCGIIQSLSGMDDIVSRLRWPTAQK